MSEESNRQGRAVDDMSTQAEGNVDCHRENDVRTKGNQNDMPYVRMLEEYVSQHYVPFHTPGHKIGKSAPGLLQHWMGPALPYDLGVMYALDDLHEPEGPLKEAQELAAQLYGAEHTWFSINGTTAIIQAMILGTVGEGDAIIVPREAHRSVIGGLVLSGARPIYMEGRFSERWGVPLGASVDEVCRTMDAHPEAKALLLVHPNYYGIGIAIEDIVEEAHRRGVIVLVDEAHGPHLPFGKTMPLEAIAAGADVVAQSTHKLAGSLTQTSMLHAQGKLVDYRRITQAHQLLQSTSPNYIFIASLDMARHQLATEGRQLVAATECLSVSVRHRLRTITGIAVPEANDFGGDGGLDCTKILIDFKGLQLSGREAEQRLRKHRIEVELVQGYHVLILLTIGDDETSANALVQAVAAVSKERLDELYRMNIEGVQGKHSDPAHELGRDAITALAGSEVRLPKPDVVLTPRQAWQAKRETVALTDAIGRISGETISYYPPGIPFLGMGERITPDVVAYIKRRRSLGYVPNGAKDESLQTIVVCNEE